MSSHSAPGYAPLQAVTVNDDKSSMPPPYSASINATTSFDATVSHDSAGMVHMSEADRLAATDANLSLETAFRSGWKLYARHWCTLTGATLFVILVASVFGLTTVAGADGLGPLVIPVGLCFLAGIFMLLNGYTLMILNAARGADDAASETTMKFGDLFSGVTLTIPLLLQQFVLMLAAVASMLPLVGVALIVGFATGFSDSLGNMIVMLIMLLAYIPLGYVTLRLYWAGLLLLEYHDAGVGIGKSCCLSWKLSKGNVVGTGVLYFLLSTLNAVAYLAFGVGLIVTIPLSAVVTVVAFKGLAGLQDREYRSAGCLVCV